MLFTDLITREGYLTAARTSKLQTMALKHGLWQQQTRPDLEPMLKLLFQAQLSREVLTEIVLGCKVPNLLKTPLLPLTACITRAGC